MASWPTVTARTSSPPAAPASVSTPPHLPFIADMDAFLTKQGIDYSLCSKCGEGKLRQVYALLSFHDPPPCYLEAA
jgi:hypothetical protein